MSGKEVSSFFTGFFVGALVGGAAALVLAPQSGEETRAQIRDKGIELKEKAEATYGEVIEEIEDWTSQGHRVALATVVKVWGSAPRPLGSRMAIRDDGRMAGSVSGGCVEAAVCQEAESVLATGEARLVGYGVEDEEAWSLGLSCGGEIEVFIERLD